jgi:exportin-1
MVYSGLFAQIQTFYEAVGYMIHAHTDPMMRKALVLKLMDLPTQTVCHCSFVPSVIYFKSQWMRIMAEAQKDVSYLKQPATCKGITSILRTNTRAAKSLGHNYIHQLGRIFVDLLNVYKIYSADVSNIVATAGSLCFVSHLHKLTLCNLIRTQCNAHKSCACNAFCEEGISHSLFHFY